MTNAEVGTSVYWTTTIFSLIDRVPVLSDVIMLLGHAIPPVLKEMRSVFPLCVIAEFAMLARDPLETIEPVRSVIFAGRVSMIFSRYAGLDPVLVIVTVYPTGLPACMFDAHDATFESEREGKSTVNGISITGRSVGVPESLL